MVDHVETQARACDRLTAQEGSIPSQRCRHHGGPRPTRCRWSGPQITEAGRKRPPEHRSVDVLRKASHGRRTLGLVDHDRRHLGGPALRRRDHRAAPAHAVDEGVRGLPGDLHRPGAGSSASASTSRPASQYGTEFLAGWLTEYSLSVDNLFIFIIILGKFSVPKKYQQTALMIGIVLALIMRGIFIAVGAAAINNFSLDLLPLRAVPALDRVEAGQGGRRGRGRLRGEQARQVGREAPARDQGVEQQQDVRQGRRQACDHADVPGGPHARDDRPAVRARLDPRDLRAHQRALPRADREHLRVDGPAPAVLPDRRTAGAPDLPVLRACVPARLHRRQAGVPRDARERAPLHQRRRAHPLGAGDPDLALARRDRADPRGHHRVEPGREQEDDA